MFRGVQHISLGAKGRMAVPSRQRELLSVLGDGHIVLTVDTQTSCLTLYPLPEWERIERDVKAAEPRPSDPPKIRRFSPLRPLSEIAFHIVFILFVRIISGRPRYRHQIRFVAQYRMDRFSAPDVNSDAPVSHFFHLRSMCYRLCERLMGVGFNGGWRKAHELSPTAQT